MIDQHHGWNVSFKPLVIGFILTLVLIFAAYRIVAYGHLTQTLLMTSIILIGCITAIVQLIFFLHLGLEERPRWNLMMFLFGVALIAVLIGGSLWIMSNLNYNVMPHDLGH
ncbi:MAG: cytochrome o ubiquinol oxidase subunit IV [Chlamydiia bacterium]|nr:cytochrome o ubiquinol oxidase subunit IV [Chlamydiia bacterium]